MRRRREKKKVEDEGRRERSQGCEEEPGREKNDCFHDYNGERKRNRRATESGVAPGGWVKGYGEQSLSANVDSWAGVSRNITPEGYSPRPLPRPYPPGNFVTARVMCVSHRACPDALSRGKYFAPRLDDGWFEARGSCTRRSVSRRICHGRSAEKIYTPTTEERKP